MWGGSGEAGRGTSGAKLLAHPCLRGMGGGLCPGPPARGSSCCSPLGAGGAPGAPHCTHPGVPQARPSRGPSWHRCRQPAEGSALGICDTPPVLLGCSWGRRWGAAPVTRSGPAVRAAAQDRGRILPSPARCRCRCRRCPARQQRPGAVRSPEEVPVPFKCKSRPRGCGRPAGLGRRPGGSAGRDGTGRSGTERGGLPQVGVPVPVPVPLLGGGSRSLPQSKGLPQPRPATAEGPGGAWGEGGGVEIFLGGLGGCRVPPVVSAPALP